jgi:hypothetical protein
MYVVKIKEPNFCLNAGNVVSKVWLYGIPILESESHHGTCEKSFDPPMQRHMWLFVTQCNQVGHCSIYIT